nr:unnamed protein product [Callosobruchus chinensis]
MSIKNKEFSGIQRISGTSIKTKKMMLGTK